MIDWFKNEFWYIMYNFIAKNNEEEYPYISVIRPSCYRRHNARVLLIRNQGSPLFADGDTPNVIITFSFWREHGLIIVDPDRPRQVRHDKSRGVAGPEIYVKPSLN